MLGVAAVGLVVGLAMPAAATEASHLINGKTIKNHTINGSKLKHNTLTGSQIRESTLGTVPKATKATKLPPLKWHEITNFTNGWGNSGDTRDAAYAVDAQGIIYLRGSIDHGTAGLAAFTLPDDIALDAGVVYVPVTTLDYNEAALNIVGGTVIPTASSSAPAAQVEAFTSLEGVAFDGS